MSGLSRTKVKTINPATGGSAADGAALLPTNYTTDANAGLAYPTGASAAAYPTGASAAAYPTGAGVSTGASYAYPTGASAAAAAPLNKPTGHMPNGGVALYKPCGCLQCLEAKAVLDTQYFRQLQKQAQAPPPPPPPPVQHQPQQVVYYHTMLTAPQQLATGAAAAPQHLATGAAAAPQHLATGAAPHQCFTGCDCKPKSSTGYIPAAATGAPPRDAYPATFQPSYTPNFQ